jgi:hypothetical protein
MNKKKQNDNPLEGAVYTEMIKFHPSDWGENYQLHHCLLSRGDVRGMDKHNRAKIHDVRNLWWEPASSHVSHAGLKTKQQYYRLLCERWGTEAVDEFVRSFNWKDKPPFTLEWLKEG